MAKEGEYLENVTVIGKSRPRQNSVVSNVATGAWQAVKDNIQGVLNEFTPERMLSKLNQHEFVMNELINTGKGLIELAGQMRSWNQEQWERGRGYVLGTAAIALLTKKGGRLPNGKYYSVAFEMELPVGSYPLKGPSTHKLAANKALANAMTSDATFANAMSELGIKAPVSRTGAVTSKTILNWRWHHDVNTGKMQLVPLYQHTSGSIFWQTLHPNNKGGISIWGGGY